MLENTAVNVNAQFTFQYGATSTSSTVKSPAPFSPFTFQYGATSTT